MSFVYLRMWLASFDPISLPLHKTNNFIVVCLLCSGSQRHSRFRGEGKRNGALIMVTLIVQYLAIGISGQNGCALGND